MAKAWAGEPLRVFGGVAGRVPDGRLQAAVAFGRGRGWGLRLERVEAAALPAPAPAEAARDAAGLLCELCRRAGVPRLGLEFLGATVEGAGAGFAAELAARTDLTTLAEFADADRAAGGRGDPLTPVVDALAFRGLAPRALLHLGRAARITLAPTLRQPPTAAVASDLGPAGAWLDALAAALSGGRMACDLGGAHAVQGQVSEALLERWREHPFLRRPAPRFLAGEFGPEFVAAAVAEARRIGLDGPGVLRTAVEFVVGCVADGLRNLGVEPTRELVLTGRTWKNGLLRKRLADALAPARLLAADELGVPADTPAPVQAALLGYCLSEGLPANLPALTGARGPRLLGVAIPGSPAHWHGWLDSSADNLDQRAAA